MESSPFEIRGIVEGFYGAFYTFPERNDLIRFLGRYGFNFYMYGPKNDRQHRMRWWDPYPPSILEEFAESIGIAREGGVRFCYAISFGVPVNYASQEDFEVITEKFRALHHRGCRSFGVLLDDLIDSSGRHVNRPSLPSVADAHARYCNRLYDCIRSLDDSCSFYACPSEYFGRAPFSDYLYAFGDALHPDVDVFYTGPEICSRQITAAAVAGFAEAVGRRPLIWDNYPANDLDMRPEMHIGPLRGRDPLLHGAAKGFVSNIMNQEEASKVALLTAAEYLSDPQSYYPEAAWQRALRTVAGEESYEALHAVAENSLASPLQEEEAPRMSRLVAEVLATLRRGESPSTSEAVDALSRYLDTLDESCYHLKNRMHNLALRRDLLPWIEALEEKIWMGRRALLTLKAIEGGTDHEAALKGMEALMHETQRNPKRIGGSSLLTLATYARRRARGTSRAVTAESMPFTHPTPGSAERTPAAPISAAEMDTDEQLSGQVEGNVIAFPDPSALDGMGHAMGSG